MAAIVEETPPECLCEDYSDHNISNNGQHVYRHCHERSRVIQHDKLFLEQDATTFGVHNRTIQDRKTDNLNQNEGCWDINALRDRNTKPENTDDADDTFDDDVEVVIFLENGTGEIRVDVVSKMFKPDENQLILAASFEIQSNETKFDNGRRIETTADEKIISEKRKESEKKITVKEAKHVHFKETKFPKHSPCLHSHKMEKECHNMHTEKKGTECHENIPKDKFGEAERENEENKAKELKIATRFDNHIVKTYDVKSESCEQKSSRVSQSESDIWRTPETHHHGNLNDQNDNNGERKITLLRRGSDIVTKPEESKGKCEHIERETAKSSVVKTSIDFHQRQISADTNKPLNTVKGSFSQVVATNTGSEVRVARRSKSAIDADDTKKNIERKEREKQRRKLKAKQKRQYKNKVPKTELEIFQRQIETGQLRSMFSRYKTEGLRYLKLRGLLHKGTFSTKYKASFQNKQVVLTIYGEDLANDIDAINMTHMGSSYFVLGFTDCMTGPYGSVWFMSMYHGLGDLQRLLSRDHSRHVIGERHSQFITAGVLIGVDFLHQHDIVHGNIKPSKVLINALGYPVLTGFVKMRDNPDREDNQAYTPAYVAPEQLRGNRSEAIDIFSVGCMAYEIVTGWTPFDGETREQTLLNIQKTCRPVYEPELFSCAGEIFLDSCLRRNARERFYIGKERCNLVYEEWFSTLNWRDFRRQILKSPILDALQHINNRATLSWEQKTVQFKWGQVMDAMCPYTASLDYGEDVHSSLYVN